MGRPCRVAACVVGASSAAMYKRLNSLRTPVVVSIQATALAQLKQRLNLPTLCCRVRCVFVCLLRVWGRLPTRRHLSASMCGYASALGAKYADNLNHLDNAKSNNLPLQYYSSARFCPFRLLTIEMKNAVKLCNKLNKHPLSVWQEQGGFC